MNNLEYLEKCKTSNIRKFVLSNGNYKEHLEGRKVLSLEIIAEQLIHLDNTLEAVVTTLENIETSLNRR